MGDQVSFPPPNLPPTPIASERLMCALFNSRFEKLMERICTWAWGREEHGTFGWIGDQADDIRFRSVRIRARLRLFRRTRRWDG